MLNWFLTFFNDEINTDGDPSMTWHGIEAADMTNPIGMYFKHLDHKLGNDNIMHFYIHKIGEGQVAQAVEDLVLTCENKNLEALKKMQTHDFSGID